MQNQCISIYLTSKTQSEYCLAPGHPNRQYWHMNYYYREYGWSIFVPFRDIIYT